MYPKYLVLILFTYLPTELYCQNITSLEENKILVYSNPLKLEGPKNEVIVLPYKGKKMILDFFSSSCIVCFRAIPKMDTLQEKYKTKVRIVLVGKDDLRIRSIYERFSERFKLKLDVVFDSTIFSKLKIGVVPKYVWIDENGIVKFITGIEAMTEENIRLFITNQEITRSENEQLEEFDPNFLLFINGNGGTGENIKYRSLLTEWSSGIPFYIPVNLHSNAGSEKFQASGVTFSTLYRYAYYGVANWDTQHSYYGHIFPYPIFMKNGNPIFLSEDYKRRFCYSLYKSAHKLSDRSIQNQLQKDLEFCFGYKARIDTCAVPCWKLSISDGKSLPVSSHNDPEIKSDAAGFVISNQPLSKLIKIIHRYNPLEVPIIDCTGLTYNIDLSIVASMTNIHDIARSLEKCGLQLEKSKSIMNAIILEEKN